MKTQKRIKKLLAFAAFLGVFVLIFSGYAPYYGNPPAYSQGYFGVGVATPNFAFSIGNGVNAYYAPMYGTYVYGYNSYYWRWYNGAWFYAAAYPGPWYPVTYGVYLPPVLAFGPPPPIYNYSPYFTWWRNNIGPWYRVHHPGWWGRHHMFLRNYGEWQSHANHFYSNHPYQNWRMKRSFGHGGQGNQGNFEHGGQGNQGHFEHGR